MNPVIALITPSFFTPTLFTGMYLPQILNHMDGPHTQFIFSDQFPIVAKFFHNRGYRNCVMYHLGDKPKHKLGNFCLRGTFTSYNEIDIMMKAESTNVISPYYD